MVYLQAIRRLRGYLCVLLGPFSLFLLELGSFLNGRFFRSLISSYLFIIVFGFRGRAAKSLEQYRGLASFDQETERASLDIIDYGDDDIRIQSFTTFYFRHTAGNQRAQFIRIFGDNGRCQRIDFYCSMTFFIFLLGDGFITFSFSITNVHGLEGARFTDSLQTGLYNVTIGDLFTTRSSVRLFSAFIDDRFFSDLYRDVTHDWHVKAARFTIKRGVDVIDTRYGTFAGGIFYLVEARQRGYSFCIFIDVFRYRDYFRDILIRKIGGIEGADTSSHVFCKIGLGFYDIQGLFSACRCFRLHLPPGVFFCMANPTGNRTQTWASVVLARRHLWP